MDEIKKRMSDITESLNRASREYYLENREIMSNREYDALYGELENLERESGIVMSGSPTLTVGYEVVGDLSKENHEFPMLSLNKTKDIPSLEKWLGSRKGILSWKLDGITIVLTYAGGRLVKAITRGDGIVGEVVTNNAKVFENIPLQIPAKDQITVRGEAVIGYGDFDRINSKLPELEVKYKNPRNLCSGSVRQLNNAVTAERHVKFFAFALMYGKDRFTEVSEQLQWLGTQGFDAVGYKEVYSEDLRKAIENFENDINTFDIPSDGLVLMYDDIEYGRSLGNTAKFPRNAMAFKWRDEVKETPLRQVVWNASRTGLINPVAVFDPVELEGATVTRASLHNLNIVKGLKLGIGDIISVYKANMIIPQIDDNLTKSDNLSVPDKCPVCGEDTSVRNDNGVETLRCENIECPAKKIKHFVHFVSRNAMNIEGLSEARIKKLVDAGIVKTPADIFRLDRYKERITSMEGFGEKSYDKLIEACDRAKRPKPERLLFALGISNIGSANAKMISRECENNWTKIQKLDKEKLQKINGIGPRMAEAYTEFFKSEENRTMVRELLSELEPDETFVNVETDKLRGKTFVITGGLYKIKNRDEARKLIEGCGGKVSSAVSGKTDYLVNNDVGSPSSKNKKAKELGIAIIDEETLLGMLEM